jgi:hypothetical protein
MSYFIFSKHLSDITQYGKRGVLFILPLLLSFSSFAQQPQGAVVDSTNAYNMQAYQYCINAHYDEAMELLQKALRTHPNAMTYYLLARIYNTENNWEDAIKAGEKGIQLDSSYKNTYAELFTAYHKVGRLKDASLLSDRVLQSDPSGMVGFEVESTKTALLADSFSTPLILLLLLILGGVFIYPIYKASQDKSDYFTASGELRFSEVILLGATVSCAIWMFFFSIANWVWAQHPHVNAYDIGVIVRIFIFERDGAETFVLYSLMFVNIAATLLALPMLMKLRAQKGIYLSVYSVMFLVAAYYFFKIHLWPPLAAIDTNNLMLPVIITLGSIGIYVLYQRFALLAKLCIVVLSAFVGLITVGPAALVDLAYILDPGLRLMHGFKVSEIYFQYDIFLSLLAALFMKMNMDLMTFSYMGQVSFFLFFVGAFFFTDKYFKYKGLSVFFVVALILARFYTIWGDNPSILGATPIRLDLWLILVFFAWKKGVRHWSVGVCIGLLVLLHRNLGLLYLGAYFELLVMMFLLDLIPLVEEKNLNVKSISEVVKKHFKLDLVNVIIVLSSIALCYILFHQMFSPSALLYRKLGIGMLPIAKMSFYWYVTVLFSCLIASLVYYRTKLGERYTSVGLLIFFLAIANSMYFFGRSHENNVLNISGILVLCLFVLFDIILSTVPAPETIANKGESQPKPAAQNVKKNAPQPKTTVKGDKSSFLTPARMYLIMPVLFIFLIAFYYSERIKSKSDTQYDNLLQSQFIYPMSPMPVDTAALNYISHNSSKLYFQNTSIDFYFYYYGHYTPQGYFSPCAAWVYKKDIIKFQQDLLNDHYYIVVDSYGFNAARDYFPYLDYNRCCRKNNMMAISKEPTKLLLAETPGTDMHVGIVDSISGLAIERADVKIKNDYTLEAIVKPMGVQSRKGVIIHNIVNYGVGLNGLTIQVSDPATNLYVFGSGNGSPAIPNTMFQLENDKWNYITAIVNKDQIKVYVNGKMVSSVGTGGLPFVNSDVPIVIGNNGSRDGHFNGYIKEVKITDGNMNEADIMSTGQRIYTMLNNAEAVK